MRKSNVDEIEIVSQYTGTSATGISLAHHFRVSSNVIYRILKKNIPAADLVKLKITKIGRSRVRANLTRYKEQHGLD